MRLVKFGCGPWAALWFHDLHVFLNHLRGLVPRPRASVGEGQRRTAYRKGYHLAGCATMADPTRTSGSFSPVSCRCLLSSWLRPHWGISQEKLPLDPGFFQFVYNIPRLGKALLGR